MNNINDFIAAMQDARANGDSFDSFFQKVSDFAASGKTPLGLNRWVDTDKPKMEDFNRDNEILDREIGILKEKNTDLKDGIVLLQANKVNLPIVIPTGADLATYTTPGLYFYAGKLDGIIGIPPDMPDSHAFSLFVERTGSYGYGVKQTISNPYGYITYTRGYYFDAGNTWSAWLQTALATPSTPYSLQLYPTLQTVPGQYANTYRKSQEKEVKLEIAVRKTDSQFSTETGTNIGVLPVSFRPTFIKHTTGYSEDEPGAVRIHVTPDGVVSVWPMETACWNIFGEISFQSAN